MADQDRERLLAAFADHLLKNRLADEKHGRYMVGWVRRFLDFPPPMPGATADECMQAYLRALETERYEDWQVEQARIFPQLVRFISFYGRYERVCRLNPECDVCGI